MFRPESILQPIAFSICLSISCANADVIQGKIISITDGDTVLALENKQHHVRISGIDAPERPNPSAIVEAKYATDKKGKRALADCPKNDRYDRKVCKVWVRPAECLICDPTLDIGLAQISEVLAWWYRAYAKDQSLEDQDRYQGEENEARLQKRGLWVDHSPTQPWLWRAQK